MCVTAFWGRCCCSVTVQRAARTVRESSPPGLMLTAVATSCPALGSLSSCRVLGLRTRAGADPGVAGYDCFKGQEELQLHDREIQEDGGCP